MKFLSIDLETTGLNPETCQTIEIGAVWVDTAQPKESYPCFHRYIQHDSYKGEAYALWLNSRIFEIIGKKLEKDRIVNYDFLSAEMHRWLVRDCQVPYGQNINVAGKNFATFDRNFLLKMPGFKSSKGELVIGDHYRIRHKIIDPGIIYCDWETDDAIPGTDDCLQRAGIEKKSDHTALGDAWLIVELILAKIKERKLNEENCLFRW